LSKYQRKDSIAIHNLFLGAYKHTNRGSIVAHPALQRSLLKRRGRCLTLCTIKTLTCLNSAHDVVYENT